MANQHLEKESTDSNSAELSSFRKEVPENMDYSRAIGNNPEFSIRNIIEELRSMFRIPTRK